MGKHSLKHTGEPGTPSGSQELHRPHLGRSSGERRGGGGGAFLCTGRTLACRVRVAAGPGGSRGCQVFPVSALIPPPAAEEKEHCSFSWLRSGWNFSTEIINKHRPSECPQGILPGKDPSNFTFHKSVQRKPNHLTERSDSHRGDRAKKRKAATLDSVKSFPLEPTSSETHLKQTKKGETVHLLIGRHHSDTRS